MNPTPTHSTTKLHTNIPIPNEKRAWQGDACFQDKCMSAVQQATSEIYAGELQKFCQGFALRQADHKKNEAATG